MGIELPVELTEVAAKAGVQWPQADEDALRASATAWREAGDKITRLGGDTDGTASRALDALQGSTGDAARSHWAKFVAPDGHLNQTAKGCTAAADRLDHAAQQVGAAKVEIVRELTALAKNQDAAGSAAASGHPTALLGLDTAVRGTAANVANLTGTLSSAIRLDSGVDVGATTPPVNASPGAHGPAPAPAQGGLLGNVLAPVTNIVAPVIAPVTEVVAPIVAPVTDAVAPVTQPVTQVVAPVLDAVAPAVEPVLEPVAETVETVTEPVRDTLAQPVQAVVPESVSGVIEQPAVTLPVDTGFTPPVAEGTTQVSTATLLDRPIMPSEAAPQTQAPAQAQQPSAPTASPVTQAAPAAPTVGAPPAAPAAGPVSAGAVGAAPAQAAHSQAARAPEPVAKTEQRPQPGTPQQQSASATKTEAVKVDAKAGTELAAGAPAASPEQRQEPALSNPVQQVQYASAHGSLFMAYLFPLGRMPRLSRKPARQLPPPAQEPEAVAVQRFEPQDHPQSDLVDTSFAGSAVQYAGLPTEHPVVQALTRGYDPLGGLHEHDWESRFLADGKHVWPPRAEGGYEESQPDELPEGTELDRFGTPEGRVLSLTGTPFAMRSLPPPALSEGYHRYRVLRALPVWRTISAEWFGQPGGGARYRTTYPVADLVALGHLMEIAE